MRGLLDDERELLRMLVRGDYNPHGPVETSVAERLLEQRRLWSRPCPSGAPHDHVDVTPAGREAYRLDALARRAVND